MHHYNTYIYIIFFNFTCRCDCDWQALMTALDTCHWFGAECILLLNTDLGSVYDASARISGQHKHRHWRRWRKWQDCCCWRWWRWWRRVSALTLNGGWSCEWRWGSNPCFNPLLAGLQQRLDKPVSSTTVPVQCHWNATEITFNITDVKANQLWGRPLIYTMGEEGRERSFGTKIFVSPLFLSSWEVCVYVWVCVCVRACLRLKVLHCLHMWACACLCASEFFCVVTPGPTPHERTLSDLYSFAVLLFQSAWMSHYRPAPSSPL